MAEVMDQGFAWVIMVTACLANFIDSGSVHTSALFVEEFEETFYQPCLWLATVQLATATLLCE